MCRGSRLCSGPRTDRDDAIGAKLVAADLNPHERLVGRGPHFADRDRDRSFRSCRSIASRLPALRSRLTSIRGPLPAAISVNQPGHLMQLAGTDDQIDIRRPLENQLLVFLGHAAQHADDLVADAFALTCFSPAERAVDLVLGMLADAARVEQDRVGLRRMSRPARSPPCAGWRRPARCRACSSGSRRFRYRDISPRWDCWGMVVVRSCAFFGPYAENTSPKR